MIVLIIIIFIIISIISIINFCSIVVVTIIKTNADTDVDIRFLISTDAEVRLCHPHSCAFSA